MRIFTKEVLQSQRRRVIDMVLVDIIARFKTGFMRRSFSARSSYYLPSRASYDI